MKNHWPPIVNIIQTPSTRKGFLILLTWCYSHKNSSQNWVCKTPVQRVASGNLVREILPHHPVLPGPWEVPHTRPLPPVWPWPTLHTHLHHLSMGSPVCQYTSLPAPRLKWLQLQNQVNRKVSDVLGMGITSHKRQLWVCMWKWPSSLFFGYPLLFHLEITTNDKAREVSREVYGWERISEWFANSTRTPQDVTIAFDPLPKTRAVNPPDSFLHRRKKNPLSKLFSKLRLSKTCHIILNLLSPGHGIWFHRVQLWKKNMQIFLAVRLCFSPLPQERARAPLFWVKAQGKLPSVVRVPAGRKETGVWQTCLTHLFGQATIPNHISCTTGVSFVHIK